MKKTTTATVKKRKIDLSNLSKVLFPDDNIIKAELIEYYLKAAPTILRHVKGRPLSFVRYPDGIHGETFFQKNRPEWAPKWIQHVSLGTDKKIDYILATEDASLYWLRNLSSSRSNRSANSSALASWRPPPPPPLPRLTTRSRYAASARCRCCRARCSGESAS